MREERNVDQPKTQVPNTGTWGTPLSDDWDAGDRTTGSMAGLGGLRSRKDARNEESHRVGEAKIAGDQAEVRAPFILVFADGLKKYCPP